jgi:hypothetical protein
MASERRSQSPAQHGGRLARSDEPSRSAFERPEGGTVAPLAWSVRAEKTRMMVGKCQFDVSLCCPVSRVGGGVETPLE